MECSLQSARRYSGSCDSQASTSQEFWKWNLLRDCDRHLLLGTAFFLVSPPLNCAAYEHILPTSGFTKHDLCMPLQVVPGRAGGGSFKRKKNYIAKKEFAYRMCARWPTIAMSKLFFRFERSFCRCMAVMSCALGWCVCDLTCFQVMWLVVRWFVVLLRYYSVLQRTTTYYSSTSPTYYSVLQSTTPVLLRTTPYYSSTTLYYKVLLCTTKFYSSTTLYYKILRQYYSSTTKYYKVLLQYYSVLQSSTSTPVLLCPTKYYASTTLYYKVLLRYYSVLQSTTQYYASTTLYYPVLQRTTLYYKVLRQYYSSTTLYYKVLLQYYSVLQSTTPVPLCTTKYYASTSLYCAAQQESTVQLHQILRLPCKMNVINDLRHIWKLISNVWSK